MKKRLVLMLAVVLTGTVSLAKADDAVNNISGSTLSQGLYLNAELGAGKVYYENFPTSVAYRMGVGYLFSPISTSSIQLGIEAGLSGFGSYNQNGTYISSVGVVSYNEQFYSNDVDMLGVIRYSFNDNFYVMGKAGLALVVQNLSASASNAFNWVSMTANAVNLAPVIELGVGFNLTQNFSMGLNYRQVFAGSTDASDFAFAYLGAPSTNIVAGSNATFLTFTYNFTKKRQQY